MNIDDLTYGQLKSISEIFSAESPSSSGINDFVGKKVLIRTYSAGVHFGELSKKCGKEVILKQSRRLWYWKCKQSISLSSIAKWGVHADSRIAAPCDIWLEAIEILPCSEVSIESIEAHDVDKT